MNDENEMSTILNTFLFSSSVLFSMDEVCQSTQPPGVRRTEDNLDAIVIAESDASHTMERLR